MQSLHSSAILVAVCLGSLAARGQDRPNILWLTSEDHGPHLGCYGDPVASTPHIDALAARGLLFRHAWSCAPVCAPARTTIISGMYPPALGAEHMRSEVAMPQGTQMFPQILRASGYYCSNNSKEDYNLTKPGRVWDDSSGKAHWRNRKPDQPFFAIFNATASHESQIRKRPHKQRLDPAKVRVPACHPDTPEVRQDWAQYYDQVSEVDAAAGARLAELSDAGLAENTIVFYYADHGSGLPRCKRWPGNSGLQVPLVLFIPERWRQLAPLDYQPGGQSERLISFVDLAPTILSLAGLDPPSWMQGHAFAGRFPSDPPPFVHGFRGRMDERYDLIRSVTDGRYVYLRNYMPHLSHGQHVDYQFVTPTTQVWRRLFDEGRLNDAQANFWRVPKAPEELYDLQKDPDEVLNLANSRDHAPILERLRQAQQAHAEQIRDTGFLSEAEVHSRAGARSPRDALRTDDGYSFGRIFAAANMVTKMRPDGLAQLREFLKDADSGVRYWGALGTLMLGRDAVRETRQELVQALSDASPSVRIAAAEALATYGDDDDLPGALAALQACADPTRTSAYAGTAAMNAIDRLGDKAAPLAEFLKTMPAKDPQAPARANEYVERLKAKLIGRKDEGGEER